MKKIALITSTRSDWGLLYPLVKELTERGNKPMIIATYAHLFPEMGDTIQELVADGFPPVMSVPARREPHEAVADTVTGFTKAFKFLKPDIVVILGDRFEMIGVATAAVLLNLPIAHIAGGTVSEGAFDNAFRNAISQMALLHFPETEKGRRRLILMGANPKNVVTAGALGVWNVLNTPLMPLDEIEKSLDFKLGPQFVLGTFHAATLSPLSPVEQMKIWIESMDRLLNTIPELKILLTFPNTDTDPTSLLGQLFTLQSAFTERVKVVSSLGRERYINAARYAGAVIGNSSSGIVEVPSLGTPVVNVGCRQDGRQVSKAVINSPLEPAAIVKSIEYALTPDAKLLAESTTNPYYRPDTPRIIADRL